MTRSGQTLEPWGAERFKGARERAFRPCAVNSLRRVSGQVMSIPAITADEVYQSVTWTAGIGKVP